MPPLLIRLRKPALIMAGIVIAMLGFAWLALPGIVQWQAEKYIAEKTGHRLTLARPEINPLALSLRLRELRLVDAAGAPLLGFGELLVDLAAASLSQRAWVFDEIRLDGLHASLVQRQEGGSNWSPLLDALQSKEQTPESKGLPRLDIRRLRIGGAQLEFADRRLTPAFATRIEPLDLELTEVSTLPDDSGKFRLSAKTSFGAQLAWQGDVTLNPLASSGRFDLGEVDLARLAPLLQDKLPIAPPAGIAALGADYRWSRSAETSSLKFEQIALSVSALRLLPVPGAASPQLSVERIAMRDGQFDLDTQQLALGSIQLQGNRLDAVQDKKGLVPVLSLDDITLSEAKLDLGQRQATLAALAIKGGGLSLRRARQDRSARAVHQVRHQVRHQARNAGARRKDSDRREGGAVALPDRAGDAGRIRRRAARRKRGTGHRTGARQHRRRGRRRQRKFHGAAAAQGQPRRDERRPAGSLRHADAG